MRVRHLIISPLAVALIGAACGGGDIAETITTTAPTTTTPEATTTEAMAATTATTTPTTSTTVPETTTTTVAPWTTLPDPGPLSPPPVLNLGDEPVTIGTLCIIAEATTGVSMGGQWAGPLQWLANAFDRLGIQVVWQAEDGCEAELTVTASGTRQSAWYHPGPQQCWTGYTVHSEATLTVGDRRVVMSDTLVEEPAGGSSSCPTADDPISPPSSTTLSYVPRDMFGAAVRVHLGDLYRPLTEDEVPVVVSGLVEDPEFWVEVLEDRATTGWLNESEMRESFLPLTPYLINLLHCPECPDPDEVEETAEAALEAITGQSFGASQESWWEWWEARAG